MQNAVILGILSWCGFTCLPTQRFYRAQGTLAGKEHDILADSEAAAKLLQNTSLRIAKIPSTEELSSLRKQYSLDYATIHLLQAIYSDILHREYQKKYFDRELSSLRSDSIIIFEIPRLIQKRQLLLC